MHHYNTHRQFCPDGLMSRHYLQLWFGLYVVEIKNPDGISWGKSDHRGVIIWKNDFKLI